MNEVKFYSTMQYNESRIQKKKKKKKLSASVGCAARLFLLLLLFLFLFLFLLLLLLLLLFLCVSFRVNCFLLFNSVSFCSFLLRPKNEDNTMTSSLVDKNKLSSE